MKNIFRIPVDHQHFKDTIEFGKPISEISKYLNKEELGVIGRISKEGIVRYWGSIPGESNKRNYEKINLGDEMICYRSGKYIALAKIAFKTINRDLAIYSWGKTEIGSTWELMYFFDGVLFFEIPSEIINNEFGYQDGPVMGFNAISEEKVNQFIKKYESVDFFIKGIRQEEYLYEKVKEEVNKKEIKSRFEAQFYLVDLGSQLKFDTYIPASDAGHEVFGKKLDELITIRKNNLNLYIPPAIIDPLSNIDVIWFKDNYKPKYFFEVIHRTGWSEALLRLELAVRYYEGAKTRIIGPKESEEEFQNVLRRWSEPKNILKFKNYNNLVNAHSETTRFNKIIESFLN